ncbi:MAG: tRNA (N6-isopentenyl adenosine(37)-C2)-methylthiotransferase MiaB [Candidatus Niyogibacteria bacterium]|nr:tRNA (N6-isopentenyl adenosine(37)-C2)-methylthiotransferase MiaB [Candidatus Niyogibacteria bacterium]
MSIFDRIIRCRQNSKKKYYLKTFGCQSNMADSDRIRGVMGSMDYAPTAREASADVIIYNTCSVRESAENRVFGRNKIIGQLKNKNPQLKTILTGCMIHHGEKTLRKRMPLVDFFLPIRELQSLPELLGEKASFKPDEYLSLPPERNTGFRAWIPISYGCNNFCTYCIVPFARGREYSRPAAEIIEEARLAIASGHKEIWLLGQNVNTYGVIQKTLWDGKTRTGAKPEIKAECITFAELLRAVNALPGDFWIRFTSAHPKDFGDDLIEAMAECEKFPKYINLPVQSGDNNVLKRMNRQYSREHYLELVRKIRARIPEMAISTDTIVGFSGETDAEFENSLKLYEEAKFDMAFIAQYSSRPGTAAAISFQDDVPHAKKEARRIALTRVLEKTAAENSARLLGTKMRLLVDEEKDGRYFGKSPQNKTVEIFGNSVPKSHVCHKETTGHCCGKCANQKNETPSQNATVQIGDFVDVEITEIGPWKLLGKII